MNYNHDILDQSIVNELSAAVLCGFNLLPRVRASLLSLRGVSLSDLHAYLHNPRACDNAAFRGFATTPYELTALAKSYEALLQASRAAFRDGRATSDTLAWIVPDTQLNPRGRMTASCAATLHLDAAIKGHLGSDYQEWLPWMSLGIVTALRRWRAPRLNSIRRVLLKLAWAADRNSAPASPWEPDFRREVGFVPLRALYHYEPTRLVEGAINALSELGLSSVHDLRCCHPDAIAAAKHKARPLFATYRLLSRLHPTQTGAR